MTERNFCFDCRWCLIKRPTRLQRLFKNVTKEEWWCEHPSTRNIITGTGRCLCQIMRESHIPERHGFIITLPGREEGPCGPDGKLWEPKDA